MYRFSQLRVVPELDFYLSHVTLEIRRLMLSVNIIADRNHIKLLNTR